ncbi:TetR/AcrR family transcriptional regulator [Sphingomonas bacterium]|uniref:TetR/AcrR family transcriptional regulator n=1 Tax=Sphingomonas bacterium TaxID=1895847 RepID=UPI0015764927|nr:TetR/AcrR family transcriptional regulator [Sphingomonas bacterium]
MEQGVNAVPKPTARGRKSAKKRLEIMRAATGIINAKSFALATMTEIAASLDLRDATLYYYFPNKQALVYECHVSSLERFEGLLEKTDQADGTGIEKLRRFLHAFLEDSTQNGQQLYFGDYSYLEEMQRIKIGAWGDRLSDKLKTLIDQGISDGSVAPCESALVVQLLLGTLIWLAKWAPDAKGLTVDRLGDAIEAFAFHGLESRLDGMAR